MVANKFFPRQYNPIVAMDVYGKELNQIYISQHLNCELLPPSAVETSKSYAAIIAGEGSGTTVVTDAANDTCYIYGGCLGSLMGFFNQPNDWREESSSDEDIIYTRLHPEDLVDKRLLEYEFFKFVDRKDVAVKRHYKAVCRIRMQDASGKYLYIDNTTRLLRLSPAGKIWLILCTYDLSANQTPSPGISPAIINMQDGSILDVHFENARNSILSDREKEILRLIQDGLPSKLIADTLHISIHTVNRHRQNILAKLSVSNSIEAVKAALAMKLL